MTDFDSSSTLLAFETGGFPPLTMLSAQLFGGAMAKYIQLRVPIHNNAAVNILDYAQTLR